MYGKVFCKIANCSLFQLNYTNINSAFQWNNKKKKKKKKKKSYFPLFPILLKFGVFPRTVITGKYQWEFPPLVFTGQLWHVHMYFHGEIKYQNSWWKKNIIWSCVHCLLTVIGYLDLRLIMLWADSAEDKLTIFFLENRIWHVMQIISCLKRQFAVV